VNRRQFAALWLGAFAFFLSFLLLLSALPIFARRLGASDGAIGVIVAAFGITSLLLRPLAGWAADRHGRRPLMLAGALTFAVTAVAYGWSAGVVSLVAVRLIHAAAWGSTRLQPAPWSPTLRRPSAVARSWGSTAPREAWPSAWDR
jgi:DHA1 family multidrug resistance protein-like MFS transporter